MKEVTDVDKYMWHLRKEYNVQQLFAINKVLSHRIRCVASPHVTGMRRTTTHGPVWCERCQLSPHSTTPPTPTPTSSRTSSR